MELKDDVTLFEALTKAAKQKVSREELQKQRVSFIYGSVKDSSGITKAKIKDMLIQNHAN